MFPEDLSLFFSDFASRVSARGVVVDQGGILDAPSETILEDGSVMVTDYMLLVRTDQFGGIRTGDVVDVGAVRFRARGDARQQIDGAFSVVPLMRLKDVVYEDVELIESTTTAAPNTVIQP